MRTTTILAALLLTACTATPRTSTEDERAKANLWITNLETGLTLALATGKITPNDFNAAKATVIGLRSLVEESKTKPMSWADVLQRILNAAAQYAVSRETVTQPGG